MDNKIKLEAEVVTELQRGKKIAAIKKLREMRGIGLKESKEMVELYSAQHDIKASAITSGSPSSLINTIKFLTTVAILAYLADTFIL
jgi:hypothetical protein